MERSLPTPLPNILRPPHNELISRVNEGLTQVVHRLQSFTAGILEDPEQCGHPYCRRPVSGLGVTRAECGHCHRTVCAAHTSPYEVKLDGDSGGFVYPDTEPVAGGTCASVCEQCFQYYQTVCQLRYLAFMEGRELPDDYLPEPLGLLPADALGSPSTESCTSSPPSGLSAPPPPPPPPDVSPDEASEPPLGAMAAVFEVAPARISGASEAAAESPAPAAGGGRHLVVLLHGVLGSSEDWADWIPVWSAEVRRRSGLAPDGPPVTPRGSALRTSLARVTHLGRSAKSMPESPGPGRRRPSPLFWRSPSADFAAAVPPADPARWAAALDAEFCVVDLRGRTLRGIAHNAAEACRQVEALLAARPPDQFASFSLVGHSFGGVYAKHMLSLRSDHPLFSALEPKNFVALAAPHLGSRRPRTWFHAQLVTKWFFSDTGRELLMEDKARVLPNVTHASLPELARFPNLMTYANTILDFVVPYGTSIIQVGRGVRSDACALPPDVGPSPVVAVHLSGGACLCFVDDGSGLPAPSWRHPPPEFRPLQEPEAEGASPRADGTPSTLSSPISEPRSGTSASPRRRTDASRRPFPKAPDPQLPTDDDGVPAECLRLLYAGLDSLPWTRVDVYIPNVRAHELIILKGSRTPALQAIVSHVLDHWVL